MKVADWWTRIRDVDRCSSNRRASILRGSACQGQFYAGQRRCDLEFLSGNGSVNQVSVRRQKRSGT
jgi:hypothetical protein